MLQSYKELQVWQIAYQIVIDIYKTTLKFPKNELFGLTSQLRRASVSIVSNIAEGYCRGTKEYVHFLKMARDSCAEITTQILIAKDLNYLDVEKAKNILELVESVSKMLFSMQNKLT